MSKKKLVVLVAAVLMALTMMASAAMPAVARGLGPSVCKHERPGQLISFVARTFGHSGTNNPGNAHNTARPVVPFYTFGCNPHAT